jgi:hypothetical protein
MNMSAKQYRAVLVKEVMRLNKKIDFLILRGQSYKAEALRHRELLSQLRRIERPSSFFGRIFNHTLSY